MDGLLAFAALRIRSEAMGVVQADLGPSALHLRIGPETPLGGPALARVPDALPGATFTPQGVLRVPVASASRPLRVLDEILGALEGLAAAAERRAGAVRCHVGRLETGNGGGVGLEAGGRPAGRARLP